MTTFNTWHQNQERTSKNTFKPKWDREAVLYIIEELNRMSDFIDIQYYLVKKYTISLATAAKWIDMSRLIMVDMNNGLSYNQAIDRDRVRRNLKRKQSYKSKKKTPTLQPL